MEKKDCRESENDISEEESFQTIAAPLPKSHYEEEHEIVDEDGRLNTEYCGSTTNLALDDCDILLTKMDSEDNTGRANTEKPHIMTAIDASKRIIQDGTYRAYKFCCVVVNMGRELMSHWELPEWLQDNEFIAHFHRPQMESFRQCFKTIFSLHSESGNIWTHIIGVIVMVVCAFYLLLRPVVNEDGYPGYPKDAAEYLLFSLFFLSACACMTFSWIFHTVTCHSQKVRNIFAKMDYTGIALLITGSSIPVLYYGFFCHSKIFYIYMGVVIFLCITSVTVSLWDVFATPKYRPLRAAVFLTFGLSNVIPIIHCSVLLGYDYARDALALFFLIAMGLLYVIGALLYAVRVPERFLSGQINLFCQSHQFFHILVVAAALVHMFALCQMASYRAQHAEGCN